MAHFVLCSLFFMNLLLMLFGGVGVAPWILETIVSPNAYVGGATAIFPVNQTATAGWAECNRAEIDNIEGCDHPYDCSERICEMTLGIDPGNISASEWVLVEPPQGGEYVSSLEERRSWCRSHAGPSYILDHSEPASVFMAALTLGVMIAILLASQRWPLFHRWCQKYSLEVCVWILIAAFTLVQVVFYALVMGLSSTKVHHPVLKVWFPYLMGVFSAGCLVYLLIFFYLWRWNPWCRPPTTHDPLLVNPDYYPSDH